MVMVENNGTTIQPSLKLKYSNKIEENQKEYNNTPQINEKLQFYNFFPICIKQMLFKNISNNVKHFKSNTNQYFVPRLFLITLFLICSTNACDIWKVHDCQGAPTKAEEELMKSDEYTTEQLYKFCDKGKAYVDCMNAKLKCCDLKMELKGALRGYDKQLEKQAWILGPFCAGLGANNVINYKCRTTRRLPSIAVTTLTPTKSTRPTMPPCRIEKVC